MAAELFRALGALLAPPRPELEPVAEALELGALPAPAEHAELFTFQLVPYASVYLSDDGRIGGVARERIGGFWRALELDVPKEPDHLGALLELHAELAAAGADPAAEASEPFRHRRRALLGEHLLPWLPIYLLKLRQLAPPFYARWGTVLGSALRREVGELGVPAVECRHFLELEPLPGAASCDLDDLVAVLLAPARSGVVLTRADLALAGRELGVASRLGERRFMLESMLKQRPGEVILWLDRQLETAASTYAAADALWPHTLARAVERIGAIRAILAAHLAAMP